MLNILRLKHLHYDSKDCNTGLNQKNLDFSSRAEEISVSGFMPEKPVREESKERK